MRVTGIIAAVLTAATVAGCAAESYYGPSYGYRSGYTPYQAYAPAPRYTTTTYYTQPAYYSYPSTYQTTTYQYSYAQQPTYSSRGYDGYWDYQRNYRGIHPAPEL
jgi:hypothetical protein